jgi:hypothetical protein
MIKVVVHILLGSLLLLNYLQAENRIPFYEDYIESGDLSSYLELAHKFLDEKPDANESPRLALDLMMMGKAAEDLRSIVRGTDLLLFDYLGSLPSLHFISSFDKGSPRLTQLLKVKLSEANFIDQNFSNSFADTIILLARIHGPELMHDPELLLSTYLITKSTDKEELTESLSKALDVTEEKNLRLSPIIKICRAENPALAKIAELHSLSTQETEFFIKFFKSQLSDDEVNSPAFLESMIEVNLFGVPPKPESALGYLASLPDEISTQPKFQVSTALAHLLNGNRDSAVSVLKSIPEPNSKIPAPWVDVAKSLLEGTEFRPSRKGLLLEQLTKLYDRWQRESDAFLIEGNWNEEDTAQNYNFQVGVDNLEQSFEIHVFKNDLTVFSYFIDKQSCLLTSSNNIVKFATSGAYPLPKVNINRDSEGGSFSYSFNLNFAKSFEDFATQISENMEIPYIATPKGREVLLNHLFERKAMWLDPPASSNLGTVFTLNKIDPELISKKYKIEISASGELISLDLGKLKINKFLQGDTEILNQIKKPSESLSPLQENDFQLSTLVEAIGDLMKLTSSSN